MKWVSIDVGIKNLAYCIFTLENGEIQVVDWNVVNLLAPSVNAVVSTCTSVLSSKNAKTPSRCCGKKAEFVKRIQPDSEECFCKTHAKAHPTYWIPTKEHTLGFLRKQKVGEMAEIYSRVFSQKPVSKISKAEVVDEVFRYYQSKLLEEIPRVPKRNANDTDLISIGWSIKREFDNLVHMKGVSHVIIENQISPIATRMKTIQGMLAQYFIMKSPTPENTENRESSPVQIHFVSSANKLKIASPVEPSLIEPPPLTIPKSSYAKNKKDGVQLCSRYLENNPSLSKWTSVLHTTKKDDLADCFLQGIWFLVHQKRIIYAENLKINSV